MTELADSTDMVNVCWANFSHDWRLADLNNDLLNECEVNLSNDGRFNDLKTDPLNERRVNICQYQKDSLTHLAWLKHILKHIFFKKSHDWKNKSWPWQKGFIGYESV